MNFYALSQLINFISLMTLGLFVLFYNIKNKVNQTYAFLNFSMAFWGLFYFFWLSNADYNTAFMYLKLLMSFAVCIPVTFTHFVFNFLGVKRFKKVIIPIMYMLSITCFILNYNNLLYDMMRPKMSFMWWPDAGRFFNFYITYFY